MAEKTNPWISYTPDDISMEYHQLMGSFMPLSESSKGPTIQAAEDSDKSVLAGVLDRAQGLSAKDRLEVVLNYVYAEDMANCSWDTPLLRVISCQRTRNIDLLLQHGANPNGIDRDSQACYASRFRRVISDTVDPRLLVIQVDPEEVGGPATQLLPLTEDELAKRTTTVSCFWGFPDAVPLDISGNGSLLHSLVMAARSTLEIFDKILRAGADAKAWSESEHSALEDEDLLQPSALCVSTPLHAAIDTGNREMLEGLLARGFNPNARALIVGCQALTPLQHAIVAGKVGQYQKLIASPRADANLVTPVFGVHVLHFAVAQLRLDLIKTIGLPLSAAPPTALGHTLLHVTCLPFDETHLQIFGPKLRQSIHNLRTTHLKVQSVLGASYQFNPSKLAKPSAPKQDGPGDPANDDGPSLQSNVLSLNERVDASDLLMPLPSTDHFDPQLEVIQRIVTELGPSEISKVDIYGNTALHYLASTRIVNGEAVKWLRQEDHDDEVWRTSTNRWGWTPSDLWKDNVTTIEPGVEMLRKVVNEDNRRRGVIGTMSCGRWRYR